MARFIKDTRHAKVEVSSNGFIYLTDKGTGKSFVVHASDVPLLLEAVSVSYSRVHEHLGKLAGDELNRELKERITKKQYG